MNGQFAREGVPAPGGLDGIKVTNDVGDGHIRCCQLFNVAIFSAQVVKRCVIAHLRQALVAGPANRF